MIALAVSGVTLVHAYTAHYTVNSDRDSVRIVEIQGAGDGEMPVPGYLSGG